MGAKRGKNWSKEDDLFLTENLDNLSREELAEHFGRSLGAINVRISVLKLRPKKSPTTWTKEDLEYLYSNWGTISVTSIAKKLDRTESAVQLKATRLGLGRFTESGTGISVNQLLVALGLANSRTHFLEKWKKLNFPMKKKKIISNHYAYIVLDDFWKWAYENKDKINFARFEKHALGKEPEWVHKKRLIDIENAKYKKDKWTEKEDERLLYYLGQFRYSIREISDKLKRTEGSIQRRMDTLGTPMRPIKKNATWWTDEETAILLDMLDRGHSYEDIGKELGRSSSACRCKHERINNPDYFIRENRREREKLRDERKCVNE